MASPEADVASLPHVTLIIYGRDDQAILLSTSLKFLHLIPGSQLHDFSRCGHSTQIED